MECIGCVRWSAPLVLLLILGGAQAAAPQSAPTAITVPAVTGPIPVTPTSVPLMASSALQYVVDLSALGYVEEEFFVSGGANVYDWAANGALSVRTPAAPYTTRILLRRPADPGRFSGNVIVEIANGARRFDFNFAWGVSHAHFIENGDAFVVLTLQQANLEGLKAFDPVRYAPLSMANPTPDETCVSGRGGGPPTTSTFEEGLRYDILSQVAALLRACNEITACTVDRRVVRCARGVGHPAGKACSAGARAHGAIAPGVGGD